MHCEALRLEKELQDVLETQKFMESQIEFQNKIRILLFLTNVEKRRKKFHEIICINNERKSCVTLSTPTRS